MNWNEVLNEREKTARKFRQVYCAIIEKYSKPVEKDDEPVRVYDFASDSIILASNEPPTNGTQPLPKEASLNYVTTDSNHSSKPDCTSNYVTPNQNYSYCSKKCLSKKKRKAKHNVHKTPTPYHSRTSQNRRKLMLLRHLIRHICTKSLAPGCESKTRRVLSFSKAAVTNNKGKNQFYDNSTKNFSCDKKHLNCSSPKKTENSSNFTCDESPSAELEHCYNANEENENVDVVVDDDKLDNFEVDVRDGILQCSGYSTPNKFSKLIPNSDKQVGDSDSCYIANEENENVDVLVDDDKSDNFEVNVRDGILQCSGYSTPNKFSKLIPNSDKQVGDSDSCYIANEENENVDVLVDDDKSDNFEVNVRDGILQCSGYSTPNKFSKLTPNSDKQVGDSDSNYIFNDEVSLLSYSDYSDKQSWSAPFHTLENGRENVKLRVADWCKTVDRYLPGTGLPTDYKDECHDNNDNTPLNEQPQPLHNEPPEEYIEDDEVVFLTLEDSFEDLPGTPVDDHDRTEASGEGTSSELEFRTCSSISDCRVLLHYNAEQTALYEKFDPIYT